MSFSTGKKTRGEGSTLTMMGRWDLYGPKPHGTETAVGNGEKMPDLAKKLAGQQHCKIKSFKLSCVIAAFFF